MSLLQSLRDNWSPYLHPTIAYARSHPLLSSAAIGIIPLLSYIIPSYNGFIAIGPGGLPSNPLGWMIQAAMRPFSRSDVTSLEPYRDPKAIANYGPHCRESFFGDEPLPQRRGSRPEVPTYVAPQRQTTETRDAAAVAQMNAILSEAARRNPKLLAVKPSGLEGKESQALWLNLDSVQPPSYLTNITKGELCHVHSEGSSHVILSFADAETAIRQGWALRHKMSGVLMSWSYIMVYAPRDEGELAVWERIVGAAVGFAAAGVATEAAKKADKPN